MTRLAIAIITWNNADDAVECAESLLRQSIVSGMSIVFIDNDSRTETIEAIQHFITTSSSPQLHFVETGYNGGTAGGFTAAAKWAAEHDIEYVGSLNADAIADEKWCEALLAELGSQPDVGIATGMMLHRDGKTIDSTGDFYTTWGLPGPRGRDKPAAEAPREAGHVFGATGGGYLARTSMYKEVGYYDEAMFMYYEDIDLSFRTQLMGYTVRYTPDAIAYHKRGASSDMVPGLAVYNTFKNLPILFTKNVPLTLWPLIYPRFILTYTLILINAVKNGRGGPALKGWGMSWRYILHMFHERWRIQQSRTVSDDYISSIILHDIPSEQTGMRKFRKLFTGKD